ncbi:hypothetical protein [Iodobacter fluviatilis]|uniref:Uncharacterized protein n=1 Tax=Iodobacter fluviatilis TaxID=537 RepID=A0A377SWS8_9NEIS|nr:hypothetical protein [Iodobacter fluviatilis]TCU85593.1 hypothetical protein EV682_107103 [Iodobacter fluviatilis]STR44959.1 Uncharacterised protein [Iodobacter fluviatilis]
MKIDLQPLQLIRHDLIMTGATLALGLLLIVLSQIYLWRAQDEQQALRSNVQRLTLQADAQENAWNNTQQYRALYQTLSQRGILNGEHRLDWIEYLTELNRRSPGLSILFRFEPQRVFTATAETVQLYGSKMMLSFEPSDEDEFSQVLAGLRRLSGWPAPEQCVMTRQAEAGAGLKVICDIEWLSIGPVAAPEASQ